MNTGIYKITNKINNKFYFGSTARNFKRRWYQHKSRLINKSHDNKHLQASWDKYGSDRFIFEIIEYCEPENCIEREQFYIDILKPQYNKCPTAGSRLGSKMSPESIEKMKERMKGFKHSEETKKKIAESCIGLNTWMLGRKLPKETCEKISKANLGKIHGPTGKPAWNKGIPFSQETCKKMSESRKLGIEKGTVTFSNKGKRFPKDKPILRDDGHVYPNVMTAALDLKVKDNTIVKACTDKNQIRRVRGFVLKYTK